MERFAACKERGKQALSNKEYQAARNAYEEALSMLNILEDAILQEAGIVVKREEAILKTNIGVTWLSEGKTDSALKSFEAAMETDPTYEKAFYRAALVLEKSGQPTEGLMMIGKIKQGANDPDVLALKKRLASSAASENQLNKVSERVVERLGGRVIESTIIRGDKKEVEQQLEKLKEIELDLALATKAMESGTRLEEAVSFLSSISAVITKRQIMDWKRLMSESIFGRLMAVLQITVELIDGRDLEKTYLAVHSDPEVVKNLAGVFRHLWKAVAEGDASLMSILAGFPTFISDVRTWNSVSIDLHLGGDSESDDNSDRFLAVVAKRMRRIADCQSDTIRHIEKSNVLDNCGIFSEFVTRISRSSVHHCFKYLVTVVGSLHKLAGANIHRQMVPEIGHLYRDNFSASSVALLTAVTLADHPANLEEIILTDPRFSDSLTTFLQHLAHLLTEGKLDGRQIIGKLENACRLLQLALGSKAFLKIVSASSVVLDNPDHT